MAIEYELEHIEMKLDRLEEQLERIADQLEMKNKMDMGLDYNHAKNMLK